MAKLKPLRYVLNLCHGSFDGDSTGVESSTPFVPLAVGDWLDHRVAKDMTPDCGHVGKGEALRVTAVKHGFQDFKTHISQYVTVVVQSEKVQQPRRR